MHMWTTTSTPTGATPPPPPSLTTVNNINQHLVSTYEQLRFDKTNQIEIHKLECSNFGIYNVAMVLIARRPAHPHLSLFVLCSDTST